MHHRDVWVAVFRCILCVALCISKVNFRGRNRSGDWYTSNQKFLCFAAFRSTRRLRTVELTMLFSFLFSSSDVGVLCSGLRHPLISSNLRTHNHDHHVHHRTTIQYPPLKSNWSLNPFLRPTAHPPRKPTNDAPSHHHTPPLPPNPHTRRRPHPPNPSLPARPEPVPPPANNARNAPRLRPPGHRLPNPRQHLRVPQPHRRELFTQRSLQGCGV